MAKRLFSADKRTEKILSHLRDNNENLSAFISAAVIDEVLPVYSQLRIEASYLLDYIIDGAKDWTGNKLILNIDEDDLEFCIRQTLSRGVAWLGRDHHIKKCDVLKDLMAYFEECPGNGGVTIDTDMSEHVKENAKRMRDKLKRIDPKYRDNNRDGLGRLGRDILDHWDKFWDDSEAYELIHSVVFCENLNKNIDPFIAIQMLQMMENQFIIEAIGERSR